MSDFELRVLNSDKVVHLNGWAAILAYNNSLIASSEEGEEETPVIRISDAEWNVWSASAPSAHAAAKLPIFLIQWGDRKYRARMVTFNPSDAQNCLTVRWVRQRSQTVYSLSEVQTLISNGRITMVA